MAEIKSTLDLIMERTKNLTLTDEERQNLRQREAEGKINGLVQKYLDSLIGIPTLTAEIEREKRNFPSFAALLKTALIKRIEPDRNHEIIFQALEQALNVKTEPLRGMIMQFNRKIEKLKEDRLVSSSISLKAGGISGTAVIPNLTGDEAWQSTVRSMQKQLIRRLEVA